MKSLLYLQPGSIYPNLEKYTGIPLKKPEEVIPATFALKSFLPRYPGSKDLITIALAIMNE